ncbi:MAG: hypothetical protein AABP62_26030 [Planctomycetota bacterium]
MSERKIFRGSRVRRAIMCIAVVAGIAGAYLYYSVSGAATAEQEAREFVLLNGYTNEGYTHTLVSEIASLAFRTTGSKPIGVQSLTGVGIPTDCMTDTMAKHLLNIRNLDNITLYPRNPDGSGVDFKATAMTRVNSLRDLAPPLSMNSITMLERKFPNVRVEIARRPAKYPNPKTK